MVNRGRFNEKSPYVTLRMHACTGVLYVVMSVHRYMCEKGTITLHRKMTYVISYLENNIPAQKDTCY